MKPLLSFWIDRIFIFTSVVAIFLFYFKERLGWYWSADAKGQEQPGAGSCLAVDAGEGWSQSPRCGGEEANPPSLERPLRAMAGLA